MTVLSKDAGKNECHNDISVLLITCKTRQQTGISYSVIKNGMAKKQITSRSIMSLGLRKVIPSRGVKQEVKQRDPRAPRHGRTQTPLRFGCGNSRRRLVFSGRSDDDTGNESGVNCK